MAGFIGMLDEYEEYKNSDAAKEQDTEIDSDVNMIAFRDMDPISDEDLLILKEQRLRHDYATVYMQSDLSFYDSYYNTEESEHNPMLEEVRNIRRLYKNIPDYQYATRLREEYMDWLVEKHGGIELFEVDFAAGAVDEWIPPVPILSKHTPGYDLFMQGVLDTTIGEYDDDYLNARVDEIAETLDLENMGVRAGVETRLNVLYHAKHLSDRVNTIQYGGGNSRINGVSISDTEELRNMFRGWYNKQDNENDTGEPDRSNYFRMTPAKIKERFYMEPQTYSNGLLLKLLEEGDMYEERDDYDPDEMVIDSKSGLPMTRAELRKREFIRELKQIGYNDVKLMRRFDVGSEYEIQLMEKRNRRHKKSRKKAKSMMKDMLGQDSEFINTLDELDNLLFRD